MSLEVAPYSIYGVGSNLLVALAGSDDEVLAVLAHELGHVHERHGLRLLHAQGLPSEPLAVMLEKLQAARVRAGKRDAAGTWLDSYPQTAARIARISTRYPDEVGEHAERQE